MTTPLFLELVSNCEQTEYALVLLNMLPILKPCNGLYRDPCTYLEGSARLSSTMMDVNRSRPTTCMDYMLAVLAWLRSRQEATAVSSAAPVS